MSYFVDSDRDIILDDVNERTLCGRLSFYMNCLLQEYCLADYFVDVEYNRKQGGRIKTILDDAMEVVKINCDIILHSRGRSVQRDNLIAIEIKKSSHSQESKNRDRKRLRALTKRIYDDGSDDDVWSVDGKTHPEHVCNYQLGFYIELNISSRMFFFEKYEQGQKQTEYRWPLEGGVAEGRSRARERGREKD